MVASIFLALGIGILIGFTLDGQEIFVEQQKGLISELEQRFVDFKRESAHMETLVSRKEKELQGYRDLTKQLLAPSIDGSLSGFPVAVIQICNGTPDTLLTEFLARTGADVTSVTYLKRVRISDYLERASEPETGKSIDAKDAAGVFIDAILTGGNETYMKDLKERKIIDISGEYNKWADFFILFREGIKGEESELELELIMALIKIIKGYGIPVVGAEKSDCEISCIGTYIDGDVFSIDNIDNATGQYSLVKVLQGHRGHYGVKDTAEFLVPGSCE